jgi:5-methylcytosine-specific restriction endonuclease McrA
VDRTDDKKYVNWARIVKVNGNFQCEVCSRTNVYLESHHKFSWSTYPALRYELSNGACLCKRCHDKFHAIYGTNCTEYQFEQFKQIAVIFMKILSSDSIALSQ